VDALGNTVRISSVGWQRDYGLADMFKVKDAGFNCVRLSWTNHLIDEDIERLHAIVEQARQVGIKVVFVNHANSSLDPNQRNGLWYDLGGASDNTDGAGRPGTTTQEKFLSDWERVAREFSGDSTVIGYDIRNEPQGYGGMCTWGDGNPDTDIRLMYEQVGNAILAIDPDKLIICEGPQNYAESYAGASPAPWGDLSVAGQFPVRLDVPNKLVYSVHDYPHYVARFEPDSGPEKVALMNKAWGYLVTQDIAPVWIGEMGANFDGSWGDENPENSRAWAETLFDYMSGKLGHLGGPTFSDDDEQISGNWWVWGNLSGDQLSGTLNDDGTFRAEQQVYWNQLSYVENDAAAPVERGTWIEASLGGMEYSVLLPPGYNAQQEYSLTLYLHYLGGAGEQPAQAAGYFDIPAWHTAYNTIVVVPRLENSGEDNNWGGVSDDIHAGQDQAIAVLRKVMVDYSTDASRVYVTGDSMGGIGTHDMLYHYNAYTGDKGHIFAAGVSIDGTNYAHSVPDIAERLKDVPFWAIHGADDGQVSPEVDIALGKALAGSDTFKLTIRDGEGHGVWWHYREDPTGPDGKPVWDWMFAQDTDGAAPAPEPVYVWDRDANWYWKPTAETDTGAAVERHGISMAGVSNAFFSKEQDLSLVAGRVDVVDYDLRDGRLTVLDFGAEDILRLDVRLKPDMWVQDDGKGGSVMGFTGNDLIHLAGVQAVNVRWT